MRPLAGIALFILRRVLALTMAVAIAAGVFHQAFQFGARFLPVTQGTATGLRNDLADHVIAPVQGRGFHVPATRLCLLSDNYRYDVDGATYEAARIHLEVPADRRGCDGPSPIRVDVHYAPWAPEWAVPAPALSPILRLFLVVAALPLVVVLAMPKKAARWSIGFLRRLPRTDV